MDVNGRRLKALKSSLESRGLSNVSVVESDLREFAADAANHGSFDRVLLDAPCSGLGVLAKRADMRWRRSLGDLESSISLTVRPWRIFPMIVFPRVLPWRCIPVTIGGARTVKPTRKPVGVGGMGPLSPAAAPLKCRRCDHGSMSSSMRPSCWWPRAGSLSTPRAP